MRVNPGNGINFFSSSSGVTFDAAFDDVVVDSSHPFKVYLSEIDGSDYKISVIPGMVNNLDPQAFETQELLTDVPRPKGTLAFNGDGLSWVYLRCGPEPEVPGEEVLYPDPDPISDGYPMVITSDQQKTDDDDYGYILLAKAELKTPEGGGTAYVELTQYVRSSLWSERFKCGDALAVYWFAAV